MKKLIGFTSTAVLALALLAAPAVTTNVSAGGDKTGQGIMVNLHHIGALALVEKQVWHFNELTAAGYFTNALTAGPTVTCNGSPTNCASGNQPATPAAPAADGNQVTSPPGPGGQGASFENRCTFLDGGTLAGRTYQQSVTVNGLNGRGNWTFTWDYAVTPTQATVEPFTAWDLVSDSNPDGTVHVDIAADVAGESVLKSSNAKLGTKYSFSLIDGTGNRVQNLAVSVDSDAPVAATSTVNYPVDFAYTTNAGSNGVTSLLVNGDARSILNGDSFLGNNNGGADGSALALATMSPVGFDLGPGSHTVQLTGTVKGNSASADISFNVQDILIIITPGCGNGPPQ